MGDYVFKLDEIDIEILRMLIKNGRVRLTEMAKRVNKTPVTIRNHLKKLFDSGVIRAVVPLINHKALGYNLSAIILIQTKPEFLGALINWLKSKKNVLILYEITGRYDLLAKVIAKNDEDLVDFIKKLSNSGLVTRVNTCLIMRSHLEKFYVPF